MSDLISKKALIKAILAERDKHPLEVEERYSFGVKVPCRFNQALRGGIRKCLNLIENAPTVDAEPVRHGHWVNPHWRNANYCCDCSECHAEAMHEKFRWHEEGIYPICPNCGAKMDIKEEERETY